MQLKEDSADLGCAGLLRNTDLERGKGTFKQSENSRSTVRTAPGTWERLVPCVWNHDEDPVNPDNIFHFKARNVLSAPGTSAVTITTS